MVSTKRHRKLLVQLDDRTVMKINNDGHSLKFWTKRYPKTVVLSKLKN